MIEIQNLTKSFGDRQLFNKFNLKIEKGEFVVFSGVSGCGKTTLLNMIGAIEAFDEGTITVDNLDVSKKTTTNKYFSDVAGFLFQNFVLIEDKTVEQNLNLIKKVNQSGVSITEALAKVGLKDKKDSKVYTLSGGEQQRVALARLMIKKCSLILADEPTGSLDRKNADIVIDVLKKLNKEENKTIIIVTHDAKIKAEGERVIDL